VEDVAVAEMNDLKTDRVHVDKSILLRIANYVIPGNFDSTTN
jgi:hypothetical protein